MIKIAIINFSISGSTNNKLPDIYKKSLYNQHFLTLYGQNLQFENFY